jgi:NAD-dependent dihydropyrimidine dehydrogenase PreA subunit
MAYVITERCIDTRNATCVEVCPVDCIVHVPGEDRMLYIDPNECVDCGSCSATCPVTAIYALEDVPERSAQFTEINRVYFDDPAAARRMVDRAATELGTGETVLTTSSRPSRGEALSPAGLVRPGRA